jgi:hypothetical protein
MCDKQWALPRSGFASAIRLIAASAVSLPTCRVGPCLWFVTRQHRILLDRILFVLGRRPNTNKCCTQRSERFINRVSMSRCYIMCRTLLLHHAARGSSGTSLNSLVKSSYQAVQWRAGLTLDITLFDATHTSHKIQQSVLLPGPQLHKQA